MTGHLNVAVTSLGASCAAGANVSELKAALRSPSRLFAPDQEHNLGFDVTVAKASAKCFADHNYPKLNSPTGRLCLKAARECVERVDVKPDGLVLGTSTGGQSESEQMVFSLLNGKASDDFSYMAQGCMASPARLLGRALGIEGPVQTVSTACTSSSAAIALGVSWIRSGRCKAVLAGGGDALCHTTITSFYALGLTATEFCRPFGPDRPGLTLGEGAGFVLLQPLKDALAMGHSPIAQIAGVGMSSDAHHMTAPPADGAGAEVAMRRALADAGLTKNDITHINAHGTGTQLNDIAEAAAITRLFGKNVPVSSCKGLLGHTLGGAGALEAVASCLAIKAKRAFENLGAEIPGDDCLVTLVGSKGAFIGDNPMVMSNSFAFGGNNCVLVFASDKPEAP